MRTFAAIGCALAVLLAGAWFVTHRDGAAAGLAARDAAHTGVISGAASAGVAAGASGRPATASPASPKPADRCAANRAPQLVVVSIRAQHAWLCARSRTVYQTPVTTGMSHPGDATPTGRFRIEGRDRNAVLRPDGGGAYPVEYWIPFDAPAYGFHDASWQTVAYGSAAYRTGGSHGCVHLPLAAIRFLYGWVKIGTPVVIGA